MNPAIISILRLVLFRRGAWSSVYPERIFLYPSHRPGRRQRRPSNATPRYRRLYTTLGASVRDLSQKQRQTEESYDAIRRQAAARGKVDGCGLCDPVRGDLDGLRRAEAGRLHPHPGQ